LRWIWLCDSRVALIPFLQGPLMTLSAITILSASKGRIAPKRTPTEGVSATIVFRSIRAPSMRIGKTTFGSGPFACR